MCGLLRRPHRPGACGPPSQRFPHRGQGLLGPGHWPGRDGGPYRPGLEVLQLEVRADNTRAVALYEHLGFEKLGLYRNFMKVNGQGFDAWYMNLYL